MVVWERADDSTTCLPRYTSAVEGSRPTKRKKKSDAQKELAKLYKEYNSGVADLKLAIDRKDIKKTTAALGKAHDSVQQYRVIDMIDAEDAPAPEPADALEPDLEASDAESEGPRFRDPAHCPGSEPEPEAEPEREEAEPEESEPEESEPEAPAYEFPAANLRNPARNAAVANRLAFAQLPEPASPAAKAPTTAPVPTPPPVVAPRRSPRRPRAERRT